MNIDEGNLRNYYGLYIVYSAQLIACCSMYVSDSGIVRRKGRLHRSAG